MRRRHEASGAIRSFELVSLRSLKSSVVLLFILRVPMPPEHTSCSHAVHSTYRTKPHSPSFDAWFNFRSTWMMMASTSGDMINNPTQKRTLSCASLLWVGVGGGVKPWGYTGSLLLQLHSVFWSLLCVVGWSASISYQLPSSSRRC